MEFEKKVVELDVNDVLPNRFQPRIRFNEESINELSESIKEHGVIQPIVVRAMGDKYEIIAGERRYKASLLAGKSTVPAVITNLNDKDSAEVALIENVQRKDLTPIEEAISYKKILDMGYLTQEELAVKLGKSQSSVANKLRLLNLDEEVQDALLNEKISERHARSLLKLSDFNAQRSLLDRIINERLTVRKTDEEINKLLNNNESDSSTSGVTLNLGPAYAENTSVFTELKPEDKEIKFEDFKPILIEDDVLEQLSAVSEDDLSMATPAPAAATPDPVLGIDIPVENPVAPVDESPLPASIDNSFLNVDNIEKNATDINPVETKPEVDLGSLLESPASSETPEAPAQADIPAPAEPAPEAVEAPKAAKFFSLPVEDEEEKKEEPQNNPDPFNFGLSDATATTTAPVQEESQENKLDELFNSLSASVPAAPAPAAPALDPVAETPSPVETVTPVEAVPITEPVPAPAVPALEPVLEQTPAQETITPAPVSAEVPEVADINFEAIAEVPSSDVMATASESLELPGEAPAAEPTPSVPVEREPLSLDTPTAAEVATAPTLTVPANTDNVLGAVKDVRSLVNTLESKGLNVNTEELNFENEYQIIIKIGK